MPANKKYLLQSGWAKTSKIIASILGGLVASVTLHAALACWAWKEFIVTTSIFSIYMLWGFFIIMVYWIKKSWIVWSILLGITLVSVAAIYSAKN